MDSISDQKRAFRASVRARISSLNPSRRAEAESQIRARFRLLPGLTEAGVVLLYVSAFAEEVETRPLLLEILRRGSRLILPRVDLGTASLLLREVGSLDELVPGRRNIPEPPDSRPVVDPTEVDWVLVPGLAFDPGCQRLGRGAGHYDRLLPQLRPDVPRWAIALNEQLVQEIPREGHDQPIDGVLLPDRLIRRDSKDVAGFPLDLQSARTRTIGGLE